MKKIALIVGCAALIGAFSITAPSPSWAAECNEQCQVEKAAKKAAKKVKKAEKKGSQAIAVPTIIEKPNKKVAEEAAKKAADAAKKAAHELKKAANKAGKEVKKLLK